MTKKYAVVKTIQTFVHHYVIPMDELQELNTEAEVELEWANDCVVCNEVEEFSQRWIGEQIISTEEMTEEQVIALHRQEYPAGIGWMSDGRVLELAKAWKVTRRNSSVHDNT